MISVPVITKLVNGVLRKFILKNKLSLRLTVDNATLQAMVFSCLSVVLLSNAYVLVSIMLQIKHTYINIKNLIL